MTMRLKIFYLSAILFGLGQSYKVFAQGNLFYYQEAKTFEFGPRIGFTTSLISAKGTPEIEGGVKLGLAGGIFGRYQLAEQWALQGDIAYSARGNKSSTSNIENGYIDFSVVPVRNVKYRMFKQDMTFDFFIGPGISILTSAEDKSGGISDLKTQLSTTEFNLVLGGGLPIGPVLLLATTRIGVSNLLDAPSVGAKWHGLTTEWSISYRFKK